MIFHSLDMLNKNTDPEETMAQSVEHANGPRFEPRPLPHLWSKSSNLCQL